MTDKISAGSSKEWAYCPECGSDEIHYEEGRHKQCAACHQEWFSDIDYTNVVRANLSDMKKRLAPETVSTPDAWMVLGEDGWRYLSGGEGDARQRMHSPTDKLYPLYRGELKVEICPVEGNTEG